MRETDKKKIIRIKLLRMIFMGKKVKTKTAKKADAKKKAKTSETKNSIVGKICEYYVPEKIILTRGAVILAPGSTKKYKTGEWRTYKPTIDLAKCIKCGKCWMVCPDAAIKKREDGKFEINHEYCKGCLLCAKECPVKCIPYEVEEK